jgi:hypothetical protein
MRRSAAKAITKVTAHAGNEAFEITPMEQRVYARTIESCEHTGAARELNASLTEAPLGCYRLAVTIGGLSSIEDAFLSGKRTFHALIFEEQLTDTRRRRTGDGAGMDSFDSANDFVVDRHRRHQHFRRKCRTRKVAALCSLAWCVACYRHTDGKDEWETAHH